MDLKKFFLNEEEKIKIKLQARSVKIKLDAIDSDGDLYIVGKVKLDGPAYFKTPRLLLSHFLILGACYIVNNLKYLEVGVELLKTEKYLDQHDA